MERLRFEDFKSTIRHKVKCEGDLCFIIEVLENNLIRTYWEKECIPEAFYLLAMVDYLSRENGLPICKNYQDIRRFSLPEPLYPRDILLADRLCPNLDMREQSIKEAIPEFLRFNIVEARIRDVI